MVVVGTVAPDKELDKAVSAIPSGGRSRPPTPSIATRTSQLPSALTDRVLSLTASVDSEITYGLLRSRGIHVFQPTSSDPKTSR